MGKGHEEKNVGMISVPLGRIVVEENEVISCCNSTVFFTKTVSE